jgi:hypothetical protein
MKRELSVGAPVGASADVRTTLDADVLTTHGVIVGMTGSGKTGMATVMLEELARHAVPLVICDLKGDLTNLFLTFPDLRPADFAPWIPASQAQGDRDAAAQNVAARWRDGLAPWGIGHDEIAGLKSSLDWRLLTPGSAVAPVNLLPALARPQGFDPDTDPDAARAQLDGTAAGLLALVGRGGDPLTDRDHVLVATLLDSAWRSGAGLDFPTLIHQIADPPVARFGVLDAESFYPAKQRQDLVLAFNTVLASPAFAVWTRGALLQMDELLGSVEEPRGTVLYLAHLAEREKLSFLTLLFSTLLAWTRRQSGSESLRTLIYLDEVQGIIPPSALPPTKPPLLTLLKQGRAFGTGVLLATQNPVDLDYKALGNAGVKLVGRLDTENDRQRALEGLDLGSDLLHETVAGLKPRQFLLAGARIGDPRVISSRWAISYLRGPLTLVELKPLLVDMPTPPPVAREQQESGAPLLPGIQQLFADAATLRPAVLVEGEVVYRKTTPSLERRVAAAWFAPLESQRIAWERLVTGDSAGLGPELPPSARLGPLPANSRDLVSRAGEEFAREMDGRALEVLFNRASRLIQEAGEHREAFTKRCVEAAKASGRDKLEQLRRRHEQNLRRLDDRTAKEREELQRDTRDLEARQRQKQLTVASGVGDALLSGLGAIFGGRRRNLGTLARRGASAARQMAEKDRMAERARAEVEESEHTIAALDAERDQLVAAHEIELADLEQQMRESAVGAIEILRITPARKDITIRRVALAWLPDETSR